VIDFKEIQIEDKPIFDSFLTRKTYDSSEFTFTNLFIWRHAFQFRFSIINDLLCVIGNYHGKLPFSFPPIGSVTDSYSETVMVLADYFESVGSSFVLKAVTKDIKQVLESTLSGRFTFEPDRNNYDYVYSSSDLLNLSGKKYRTKRNHLNKFMTSYNFNYEPITSRNIEECLEMELEWADKRLDEEGILDERTAIIEAFSNYEALALEGGALRVNGNIQAFSLGELLNPNMAVIHIEKANTDYDGCYAAINQQFIEHCWRDIPFINREEDMGIPGLRRAKESYHPVMMIEKYTGILDREAV
jgi:hypothetical protein